MDIFDLFTLCGGLAFFLFGMDVMGMDLEDVFLALISERDKKKGGKQ